MATENFRVYISGGTVSLDAWRLAKEALESDLPELSEGQKEAAQMIGMAEPEYARGVLAEAIGERRQQEIGRQLGQVIGEIIDRAGLGWKLELLARRGAESIWVAGFDLDGQATQIEIPLDLAEGVVGPQGSLGRNRLERLILTELDTSAVRKAS
jgi:hypothetical protein